MIAALLSALLVGLLVSLASPAQASDTPDGNVVRGVLQNTADNNAPVEGVTITVTSQDGQEYADTSDAAGEFLIEVPGEGGPVTIELDMDTLPEGVTLREEGQNVRKVVLLPNQEMPVLFAMGPDTRDVETKWDRLPGLVYSGLLFGLVLSLAALGLSMIFGTTGLTNFAHGELVGLGALLAYFLSVPMGIPFLLAVPLVVVIAMALGWAQDRGLWRPLRRRGTSLIAMMIITIGMQLALRYLYQFLTDGQRLNYQDYLTPPPHDFFGLFTYTSRDIAIIVVSVLVVVGVILALSFTRLGRATRAVSDNPALAASTGINVDRVISVVWIIGAGLAALSGVFLGFVQGVTYDIGQLVLLLLFAAVVAGGLGSVWGALIGSLLIGVLLDVSTLFVDAEVKNAGALLLLVLILLIRPQGLLGRKERIG
ncbi:branched-chain amino acid ABC transporter permease [Nocardioides insulae]|uniref:branched-chain amino acid ABC transporter permease n=1 Tax=Nocardioides insulae TaxID=394734 RepID=UPI000417F8C5|nr:branched-chain amino acid ABC transporter permease [Nocardioides insulae]